MSTYNTVIKKRNAQNNGWDSILPITTAENVLVDESGKTVKDYTNIISGKNYLINGNFDIWQNGTTFDNPQDVYTADMFKIASEADTKVRALRSLDVPNSLSKYSFRMQQLDTIGASGTYTDIMHYIEDYKIFKGQKVTFSFYAKFNSGSSGLAYIYDGHTLEIVYILTPVDDQWHKYQVTKLMSINSTMASITLRCFRNGISPGNGANFAQCKLEFGDIATPFVPNTFAEELSACQRYYEKTFSYEIKPANGDNNYGGALSAIAIASSFQPLINWRYKVVKRITPTVTLYCPSSTSPIGQWSNGLNNTTDARSAYGNDAGTTIDNTDILVPSGAYFIHAVADARL
ncbi:hypothetical protein [Fusibacter sp. 3D3]|uniref:hypothetical protein n=1 Tax=Fusibacter sp. 3D3 TaxID=1048380 RepID=UPI000853250E|nr:hypothetical protein [Fusibacter sp. 3D3]GAU79498.1 hypothetical protein F3D3_4162 [Fusibacter sp. 3D3]